MLKLKVISHGTMINIIGEIEMTEQTLYINPNKNSIYHQISQQLLLSVNIKRIY